MNRLVELSKRYIPIILVIASVSGCMSIGSSEYSCPGLEEGVICMSTRDVYEATENSNTVRKDSVKKSKHVDDRSAEVIDSRDHSTEELKANLEYYKDKAISDPSTENVTALLQLQELVEKREKIAESIMASDSAPEAQAMRSHSSNMRVWVSPWRDQEGDLNLSGYIYTEVEKRQWLLGKDAVEEPSRIVPLQVVRRKEEGSEKSASQRTRGNSGINPLNQ